MNESSQGGLGYDGDGGCLKSQARGEWMACGDRDGDGTPRDGRVTAYEVLPISAVVASGIVRAWGWVGWGSGGVIIFPKAVLDAKKCKSISSINELPISCYLRGESVEIRNSSVNPTVRLGVVLGIA